MNYRLDRELKFTYDSRAGYYHFILQVRPGRGAGTGVNAALVIEPTDSRYVREWLARLIPCEPDALHVALAGPHDARRLWDPCALEDPQSPSAMGRRGCICWKTSWDPVTGLPVASNHVRTAGGDDDEWRHHTFAPLSLPPGERLEVLVIDAEANVFWVRTDAGTLVLLPEATGVGYGVGYRGSRSSQLARMIERIVQSDGHDVTPVPPNYQPDHRVYSWLVSAAADRTQELTLDQLKTVCRTGFPD